MKKIILFLLVLSAAVAVNAQDMKHRMHPGMRKHHEMMMKQLKLSEDQKTKFHSLNEDFRKQLMDLKKNEDITVRELKNRMKTLHKDHKEKIMGLLTVDQKAKIEKMKAEHKAMQEIDAKARLEKMKISLSLTNEQADKINKNRLEMAEKMKALREDDKMDMEKKREQMKELMKQQKEKMKSILTAEQFEKIQEFRPPKPPKREVM